MTQQPKRVLFKISGEALSKSSGSGIDEMRLTRLTAELRAIRNADIETAVVIGGGNILRGMEEQKELQINRVSADQMGMLATLINGMALADALKAEDLPCLLTSTLSCPQIADLYNPQKSLEALGQGKIIICTTGAGTPYLTTDTGAALRACELKVDLLLKATMHVDGVYNKDPLDHSDAIKYESITYKDYLSQDLQVMDPSAITLCMDADIPIRIFNFERHSLENAVYDSYIGSVIHKG